jgi:hypothetical protein
MSCCVSVTEQRCAEVKPRRLAAGATSGASDCPGAAEEHSFAAQRQQLILDNLDL